MTEDPDLNIYLDLRWINGVRTHVESFLLSIIKAKELLEKTSNRKINLNVYAIDWNDAYKINNNTLEELIKNNLLGYHQYISYRGYTKDSAQVSFEEIFPKKEDQKKEIKFFSNWSLFVLNDNLNGVFDRLDSIIDKYSVGHFHGDIIMPIITDLKKAIDKGKLKVSEKQEKLIYELYNKRIREYYTTPDTAKKTLDLINYLFENNDDFKDKEDLKWIIDLISQYKKLMEVIKKGQASSIFPTSILFDNINSFFESTGGDRLSKVYIHHSEPHYLIPIYKNYLGEINEIKKQYTQIYGSDNNYNLNGRIKYWILYNGRVDSDKGFSTLVKIYEKLLSEGEQVGLIVISSNLEEGSSEYKELEDIVKKYNGKTVVHLYGDKLGNSIHDQVLNYLSLLTSLKELKNTVYLNPALQESYGLSMLEALIIGELPVVYRNIDGIRELSMLGYLKKELSGLTDEDLYKKVKEIIDGIKNGNYDNYVDRDMIEKLKKEMDPEEFAKKYVNILRDIIEDNDNYKVKEESEADSK